MKNTYAYLGAAGVVGLIVFAPIVHAISATVPCSDPRGCPDLVVDPKTMNPFPETTTFTDTDCAVVEGQVTAGTRKLLRFTSTTPNFGKGDLIVGAPSDHPEWFVWAPCHGHYHFREYADYRLWTPSGYKAWQKLRRANLDALASDLLAANPSIAAQMVEGHKQGFCVIDLVEYPRRSDSGKYYDCGSNQGISVGWADEYGSYLEGQWIDVTDLPLGPYVLEDEVNAERLFDESSFRNNSAAVKVKLLPPAPPPANDNLANAIVVRRLPLRGKTSNEGATMEANEPSPCGLMDSTIWYSFTPRSDMNVIADTFGSTFDTVLAAYSGNPFPNAEAIACNDDDSGSLQSQISFHATAGVTYYFQVGGFAGSTGTINLRIRSS